MSPQRRRSMAELLAEQQAMEPDLALTGTRPASSSPVLSPAALPAPYTTGEDGALSHRERDDLATCEAALDNLRAAFATAGKALQVIRDARLYRDAYATFEAYLADRWDMSRAQAYRLIGAWPLAERLSPIGDKLTESQVRELLPLAERHGQDAAITVYQAVADTDGVQVTAANLHGAVCILPADHFDPAEAVQQIRAYLTGRAPRPAAPTDPIETFTAEATRLLRGLHRVTAGNAFKAALAADPDAVKRMIGDMRAMLDELEQGTARE